MLKIRSRDPNCRWDRYMLLTFDDPPANVRVSELSVLLITYKRNGIPFAL